ncbi:MAG: hypothetical protein ACXVZR_10165 [Terriglobales bacterium]
MKGRIVLAVALLLLTGEAMATTVIPMSVEELTRAASQIVEARALSARSEWNQQHSLIYTYTTFQVTRGLKGAAAQTITVKQLGGSAGGYTQKVSGVHHAQPGEEALLFLRPSEAGDGTYVVVGLIQGNFRVFRASNGEATVSNGIGGAHALAREGGRVTEFTGAAMPLGQAEARIQRAMP